MTLSILGSLITLSFFVAFVGIAVWTFLPSNKAKLKAYGEIPLKEGQDHEQ